MKVYGSSVLKGLLYTLKTFVSTYVEDFRRKGASSNGLLRSHADGVVTVEYPEKLLPIGATYERFRVLPMLIYDQQESGEKDIRCTSCGICAKVCPPQCIWIVQETDENKKPVPKPEAFYIDTSVCMNCGLCSEFCPFDAIKMDHKFDLNTTSNRQESYLYDMERLLVPAEYYAELHPKANAAEEEARRLEAEAKAKKEAAKKEAAAKKAVEAKAAKAAASAAEADAPKAAKADDPERAARIAAAKAKAAEAKAKREAAKAADGAETADAAAEVSETSSENESSPKASDEA
ncbi:MAG: 4Fe-4S binding protein [Candidatus Sericytochromatia bacterium]|nr:4Fe-4S binding protein [Candidatus Sericytochromatia bacterium]